MLLNLTDYSNKTLHEQISGQIIHKIISGDIHAGDELDSVGYLAREHHVSKNTVKRAYDYLAEKNVIEFKNEYGFYVKSNQKENLDKFLIDLGMYEQINHSKIIDAHKLEEELKLARNIQADLLPDTLKSKIGIKIEAYMCPSQVVSGDLYDYFEIDERRIGFVIADASGKGMPAAILISQIQAILKSELNNGCSLMDILIKLNRHMFANSSARNFTTFFFGVYNDSEKNIHYVNAGHNYPIKISKDGQFQLLKTTAPALGLMEKFDPLIETIKFDNGDLLLLYTDGITESMDKAGVQFGEGKLIEMLLNSRDKQLPELVKIITDEVNEFSDNQNIPDDRTILLIQNSYL